MIKSIHNLTFERIYGIIVFVLHRKLLKKGECLYILNDKIKYYTKEIIKLSKIVIIGLFIISAIVLIKYKPMYSIKLGNKKIGYLNKLENFDNYIEEVKDNENIAFVELKEQPQISINLVSRNTRSSEDEIKSQIKDNLQVEYTSYAITYKGQNIAYLSNMEKAEDAISKLNKNSNNNDLGILQVYSDNYDEISAQETETAIKNISKLIKKQDKNKVKLASNNNNKRITDATNVKDEEKVTNKKKDNNDTSKKVSKNKTNKKEKITSNKTKTKKTTSEKTSTKKLVVGLSKPLNGIITSRYGGRRSPGGIGSTNHKGLDIAAKRGTTIKVAAGGTVKFAGYKGSLGNLVIIDHGNGMQTYYGHCSKIYVKKGQKVETGEKIAAVGSTGAATGPHLHFEIHIKGATVNPQNYLY